MTCMMDTYRILKDHTALGVVTGKPLVLGGSLEREEGTGRGVFVIPDILANSGGVVISYFEWAGHRTFNFISGKRMKYSSV